MHFVTGGETSEKRGPCTIISQNACGEEDPVFYLSMYCVS